MAYENFTTFTEYDNASYVTVISSTSLSFVGMSNCNKYGYIVKDYGIHYFWEYDIDVQFKVENVTYNTHDKGGVVVLGLGCLTYSQYFSPGQEGLWDRGAAFHPKLGGLEVYVYDYPTGTTRLDLKNNTTPANQIDSISSITVGNDYYLTLERSELTIASLYVYTDASRTSLLDTLTVTTHQGAYRFLYACSGRYGSCARNECNWWGYVKNLEIVDAGSRPIDTPSLSKIMPLTVMSTGVDGYGPPDTVISIPDSTHIEAENIRSWGSKCNRAYYDYSANYFSGDYAFHLRSIVTDVVCYGGGGLEHIIFGLCVDETCPPWSHGGEYLAWNQLNARMEVMLRVSGGGYDSTDQTAANNYYYFHFQRQYGASSTTLTAYIYMDDARTELLDTLTMTGQSLPWTRVVAVCNYRQSGSSYDWRSFNIEYVKFVSVILPDDPGESGPSDGATNGEWPEMELFIDIPEDEDDVTVYFYTSGGTLIGTATGSGGQTVSTVWTGLECEEEYGWYVVIDNGYSTATSSTWYFTCGSCDVFTIASESHPTIHLGPPRFRDGVQWNLSKEIQRFGFWSDNWAVHDNGVEREPLTLVGWEWIDEDGDIAIFHRKFTDIHDLMNLHEEIAISGLGDCIDGYYYIKNFNFKTVKGAPRCREWRLELEFSRDKTW